MAEQLATEVFAVTRLGLARPQERLYLLVFVGSSTQLVPLPMDGEILIGRAPDVPVVIEEAGVSRHHAALVIEGGRARIRDLGSQNGTHVDGKRVAGEQALHSGAVIAVCSAQLVFHGPAGGAAGERAVDLDALHARIDAEVERAAALERPVAVVAVRADHAGEALLIGLGDELGGVDRAAAAAADEVVALLAELDADEAEAEARRLVATAGGYGDGARGGLAIFPRDGADAATLVAGARAAVAAARPGEVAAAPARARTVAVGSQQMLVADEAMIRLVDLLERIAVVELPVLVLGETGTGKEMAAAAVHHFSPRKGGPLVSFNCAALQDSLAESELFGHDKGAFSGAHADKIGLLESASKGTVFLDEIGELTPAVQAKLLRVLETRRFTRVGSVAERAIDVRVVAATNRDLVAEVEAGRFRRDLYFRLSAATLWLPPLRDRPREVRLLARSFLAGARRAAGRKAARLSDEAERRLAAYPWPGNIRELKNCMDFLAAATPTDIIDAGQVEAYLQRRGAPGAVDRGAAPPPTDVPLPQFRPIKDEVRELERRRMDEALRAAHGNQTLAAALIEMPLRTFVAKLKQYGMREPHE
jgi:DNA-binding NtrC family response regulator